MREVDPSLESVDTVDDYKEVPVSDQEIEPDQQPEPEEPQSPDQRPAEVRKLDSHLEDGNCWQDSMVVSVIHEHCIGSVIRE